MFTHIHLIFFYFTINKTIIVNWLIDFNTFFSVDGKYANQGKLGAAVLGSHANQSVRYFLEFDNLDF